MQQFSIFDYLPKAEPIIGSKLIDNDGEICFLQCISSGGYMIFYPSSGKLCLCPLPAFKYFYHLCSN